jgi:cell wall-associated NlpC family hydrolase
MSIISTQDGWNQITCDYDGYEGFIQTAQIKNISSETITKQDSIRLVEELFEEEPGATGTTIVPLGSEITDSQIRIEASRLPAQSVVVAQKLLNTPYLWGGRSSFGIDCSGLVQTCYKLIGIKMPRDAYQQSEIGETIVFSAETRPGDLAFFDNEEGKITHVGIVSIPGQIIHAYGRVRIDSLDQHGIYNDEESRYTHRLRIIKRL